RKSATSSEPFSPWVMIGAVGRAFLDFLITVSAIWRKTCVTHFPIVCAPLFSTRLATTCTPQCFSWSRYSHLCSPFFSALESSGRYEAACHGGLTPCLPAQRSRASLW